MNIKLNRNKLYEAFVVVLWNRYVEPEVELKYRGWQGCRGQRDMYKSCVCFHARNALQRFLGMLNKDFNDVVPTFNSGTAHSYVNKHIDGGKINVELCDERCVALAHDFINKNPELFTNIFNVKKYPVLSDAFDAEMTRPSKVPYDRR